VEKDAILRAMVAVLDLAMKKDVAMKDVMANDSSVALFRRVLEATQRIHGNKAEGAGGQSAREAQVLLVDLSKASRIDVRVVKTNTRCAKERT
jgi:hypothetical protein